MVLRHLGRFFVGLSLLIGLTGRLLAGDAFRIFAPAFAQGKPMPSRYAYAMQNKSPELKISGVPANARSLALIMDDPDSPGGLWTHWLAWNLPRETTTLAEGRLPTDALIGKNSFDDARYDGPAPPSGTHRYFFHLYALDAKLTLPAGAGREALLNAMEGHIVGKTEMFGTYEAP